MRKEQNTNLVSSHAKVKSHEQMMVDIYERFLESKPDDIAKYLEIEATRALISSDEMSEDEIYGNLVPKVMPVLTKSRVPEKDTTVDFDSENLRLLALEEEKRSQAELRSVRTTYDRLMAAAARTAPAVVSAMSAPEEEFMPDFDAENRRVSAPEAAAAVVAQEQAPAVVEPAVALAAADQAPLMVQAPAAAAAADEQAPPATEPAVATPRVRRVHATHVIAAQLPQVGDDVIAVHPAVDPGRVPGVVSLALQINAQGVRDVVQLNIDEEGIIHLVLQANGDNSVDLLNLGNPLHSVQENKFVAFCRLVYGLLMNVMQCFVSSGRNSSDVVVSAQPAVAVVAGIADSPASPRAPGYYCEQLPPPPPLGQESAQIHGMHRAA